MKSYAQVLGGMSPSAAGTKRVSDIVAALAPPPKSEAGAAALVKTGAPKPSLATSALGIVPGVVGGGIGAFAWKKHRVLGFVAGHALVSSAAGMVRGGQERTEALCGLGVESAAIAGSLLLRKTHPILGFVAGWLTGAVAVTALPGSPMNTRWKAWYAEHQRK